MIRVVDYGMGNVGSIVNMLRKLGADAAAGSSEADLLSASRLVLPGVGAFDEARRRLDERGMVGPLETAVVERGVPVLGICLGMQLLADRSAEGSLPGLGWIPGAVVRLTATPGLKIPHMGWSTVRTVRSSVLDDALADPARFYFVHSYAMVCDDPSDAIGMSVHGHEFTSVVGRGHVYGAQFHPEKSHRYGQALLAAWLAN